MAVPAERPRLASWACPLAVALVTAAVFLPGLRNGFVNWDDEVNLVNNPYYRGLAPANLAWMFTTFHAGHYQPLAWVTLGFDHLVWGMNPAGYHLTSLLLHASNAALVYLLILALLPSAGRGIAAASALFYSIHPLRVESVSWATERRDVLAGFFILLSVLLYLRMQREREGGGSWRRWLAASSACFGASLLSKSLGIMLPLVLLVLDAHPLGRFRPGGRGRVLLEKVPFVLIAGAFTLLTFRAMGEIGAVRPLGTYAPFERLMQAAYGLCFYIGKTIVPTGLSPLYPLESPMDPWAPRYLACLGLCAAAGTALVCLRRRVPGIAAAAAAYAILVAPVLGLVVTGRQITADRYTYLACIPWSIVAAALLARVGRVRAAGAGAVAVLGLLAILSVRQVGVWRDSYTLWDHALSLDQTNQVAWTDRGIARGLRGDPVGALQDLDRAVALAPKEPEAWRTRGLSKYYLKDYAGAIADYDEARRLAPPTAKMLTLQAVARRAMGELPGALADLDHAITIDPGHAEAWLTRGQIRFQQGDVRGAWEDGGQAVGRNPGVSAAWQLRGDARRRLGDAPGARGDYDQAIRLDPRAGRAHAARALARADLGDVDGAIVDFTSAIELGAEVPESHANRGRLRLQKGDRAGALADFEAALRTAPPDWPHRASVEGEAGRLRP